MRALLWMMAALLAVGEGSSHRLAAQTSDWPQIQAEIERLFPLVKARWEIKRAALSFPAQGYPQTLPAETLDDQPVTILPRETILARLAKLRPDQREIYLRWLVGHELWHRRQYELRADAQGQEHERSDVTSQQWECEADIMGSAFASEVQAEKLTFEGDEAAQAGVREALKLLREAVDPKQTDPNASPDYPNLEQRRTATRFGVNLGLMRRIDRPGTRDEPGAREALANLAIGAMMGEDPKFEQWLAKVCSRIVHSGDAVSAITFNPARTQWNKTGNNPTVDARVPVYNRGDDPARVFVQVATAAIKREEQERGDTYYWNLVDAQNFSFVIQPNTFEDVVTHLSWLPALERLVPTAGSEYIPALISPAMREGDPLVLFDAVRIPRQVNIAGQTPLRQQFAVFLQSLSASAIPGDRQYQSFKALPCDYGGKANFEPAASGMPGPGSVSCKLTGLPAPFERGELIKEARGRTTWLSLDLPEIADKNAAIRQFEGMLADMRELFPSAKLVTTKFMGKQAKPLDRFVHIEGLDRISVSLSIANVAFESEPPSYAISMGVHPSD